jgi:hypothetical protein
VVFTFKLERPDGTPDEPADARTEWAFAYTLEN